MSGGNFMSKFLKLGATALAMALSITLVAPITANAEVTWTEDGDGNKTWTNENTKKSLSDKDYVIDEDGTKLNDYVAHLMLDSKLKAKTIDTNSYNETVDLLTTVDVARFESFKSNNKALKVKVLSKTEYKDPAKAEDKLGVYAYKTPDDRTFYYRNVKDEIISTTDGKTLPRGLDYGSYTLRLYTKKAGTYKVKYKAILKDGTTVKKSFKVIAKEDKAAVKCITFGGKYVYKSDDAKLNGDDLKEKGFGTYYTMAKSGRIRVTMNPDFKLKKIEVGTRRTKVDKDGVKSYDLAAKSELDETYNWKKIKNGKKIKLCKEDTAMYNKKAGENQTLSLKNTSADDTVIRITYYDKKNKTTERDILVYINRVLK